MTETAIETATESLSAGPSREEVDEWISTAEATMEAEEIEEAIQLLTDTLNKVRSDLVSETNKLLESLTKLMSQIEDLEPGKAEQA